MSQFLAFDYFAQVVSPILWNIVKLAQAQNFEQRFLITFFGGP